MATATRWPTEHLVKVPGTLEPAWSQEGVTLLILLFIFRIFFFLIFSHLLLRERQECEQGRRGGAEREREREGDPESEAGSRL